MEVLPIVAILSSVWLLLVNVIVHAMNEHSWIAKKIGFSGALTVSNRAEGVSRKRRPHDFFAWDLLNPEHLVSGYFLRSEVILAYRVAVLVFFTFSLIYQGVWGSGLPLSWIIFFTNWSFIGMGLYAALGIVISYKAVRGIVPSTWSLLEKSFVIVFITTCICGTHLSVFYWGVLYDGSRVRLDSVFRHGINVIALLGEIFVSKIPVCSYHFQVPVVYGTVYAVFGYSYYGISGDWIYEALSWEEYLHLIYFLLLPFALVASFFFMYLCAYLRQKIFGRLEESSEEFQPAVDSHSVEMSATL